LVPDNEPDNPGEALVKKTPEEQEKERLEAEGVDAFHAKLQAVLESQVWQSLTGIIILLNALVIGLETDNPGQQGFKLAENLFLFIFTAELIMKVSSYGPEKFYNHKNTDFEWNCLDTTVVSIGLLDFIIASQPEGPHSHLPSGAKKEGNHSFATLLRIVRLLRLVRIFRLFRFLKKLYLLMVGLGEAVKATFWVTILMSLILYTCSIVLSRTLGHTDASVQGSDFLRAKFGSVGLSMLSLFEITSSPDLREWQDQGVLSDFPFLAVFLVMWVVFGSFGMIAMLTGVISESMFEKNQARVEELRIEHEEKRVQVKKWCSDEFALLRKDDRGEASTPAVTAILPKFALLLAKLEIEFQQDDLDSSPEYMDEDESGGISGPEFLHGLMSIAEGARPVSFQEIKHIVTTTRVTGDKNYNLISKVMDRMVKLEDKLELAMKETVTASRTLSRQASRNEDGADTVEKKRTEVKFQADIPTSPMLQPKVPLLPQAASLVNPHDLDTIWASCESLAPKLSGMVTSVDRAMECFERLKGQLGETVADKLSSSQRSFSNNLQPATELDTSQGARTLLKFSAFPLGGVAGASERSPSPDRSRQGAQGFEVELAKVMETVRSEALATHTASISSEKALVGDLISQLKVLLADSPQVQQLPGTNNTPGLDPEGYRAGSDCADVLRLQRPAAATVYHREGSCPQDGLGLASTYFPVGQSAQPALSNVSPHPAWWPTNSQRERSGISSSDVPALSVRICNMDRATSSQEG